MKVSFALAYIIIALFQKVTYLYTRLFGHPESVMFEMDEVERQKDSVNRNTKLKFGKKSDREGERERHIRGLKFKKAWHFMKATKNPVIF